jgi:DNA-binding MarR family transcriptional regulator
MQSLSWQTSLPLQIAATRRRIKQLFTQRLRGHGLTPQQMGVLLCLSEAQGCTLGEVAQLIASDDPTASRVASKLTGKGLVKMATDAADRRRSRLHLTSRGSALVEELRPLARSTEEEIVQGLAPEDLALLRRVLEKVAQNVERAAETPPPVRVARKRR